MNNSSSSSPSPLWIELPQDVMLNILHRLSLDEILDGAERVCTTWRSVCSEPSIWRVFDMECSEELHARNRAENVFRRAVSRSRGEMIEVNIEYFGTDDSLRYVSERLSNLKILSIKSCGGISPQGLVRTVKNFPRLEELHLFDVTSVCALDIDNIGASCPMVKSFTFSNSYLKRYRCDAIDNSDALSIAKKVPSLLRLCLFGNLLGNEGLIAILDGCPNLEMLDLGECFNLHIKGGLGRRCSDIKEFFGPFDALEDYSFDGTGEDDEIFDSDIKQTVEWMVGLAGLDTCENDIFTEMLLGFPGLLHGLGG